ncbi:MAG: hypothetical protein NC910_04540 [Candidatus Omnitrophica bacterium]|nr:hypothetical protein [Candidatus Omnitrophota bacterium]
MKRSVVLFVLLFSPAAGPLPLVWAADGAAQAQQAGSQASPVPLDDIPALPQGTQLFWGELQFAQRGRIGGYAMRPCKYGVFRDAKNRRTKDSEEAMYFRYLKTPYPAFVGGYIVILGDLSEYLTMTFWVRGKKGGETFELGMNDTVSNKREDAVIAGSIYRYLPDGITTEWRQVIVPLEDFFGADLKRVYTIVLNFNEEGEGTLWISDIEFHKELLVDREGEIQEKGYLLLDNFDHTDVNLLGRKANAYKRLPSVCEFSRVEDPRMGEHGRSLRLDFDKQTTGWCGYYTLLNQIDGAYYDLTPYKNVSFWVRGEKGGETFEIGMADKSWLTIGDSVKAGMVDRYLPQGVTTQWQEVVIPLSDFGKLDWTQMGSFVINFPKPGRGAVFIDNLRLNRKSQEDLLNEWGE